MLTLHAPIRVYVMDMDEASAHDEIILDEMGDYSDLIGTDRFVILPCTIGGRAFNVAKSAEDYGFMPVSSASSDGVPQTYGNVLILGYTEDGHRGLTQEEVVHIERHVTMTIRFSKSMSTHYVINDMNVTGVEYDDDD